MAAPTNAGDPVEMLMLVPEICDLQTGGNVYNRRMAEELASGDDSIRTLSWDTAERPSPPAEIPEEALIVIDSLLPRRSGPIRRLREARPEARLVLLVHYLRAMDPTAEAPSAAQAEREALRVVDGAVAPSRYAREALLEEGMDPGRVAVAPPGLGERFRGPLPSRSGAGPPRILTVANLLPEKGICELVDILAGLRSLPWTWTLVGDLSLDPAYANAVRRRAAERGLSGRVTFTGALAPSALRVLYDRANLFALPSRFETLGMSMREAMARGLPVVAYDVGGASENVGGTRAGHLVPPGREATFRSALQTLLTDPMARRRKGREGWRRSQDFPSWPAAACRFREALEKVGGGSESHPTSGAEDLQ